MSNERRVSLDAPPETHEERENLKKDVTGWMELYKPKLLNHSFDSVTVIGLSDKSKFTLHHSCPVIVANTFLVVFTRGAGDHIFDMGDVDSYDRLQASHDPGRVSYEEIESLVNPKRV